MWSSDEHFVSTECGTVVRARSVKARAENIKLEDLLAITGSVYTPTGSWTSEGMRTNPHAEGGTVPSQVSWKSNVGTSGGTIPEEVVVDGSGDVTPSGRRRRYEITDDNSAMLRKWKVTKTMVDAFGYSPGCGKCEQMQGKTLEVADHGHAHSESCRRRMESLGSTDPRFATRIQESEREVEFTQHVQDIARRPVTITPPPGIHRDVPVFSRVFRVRKETDPFRPVFAMFSTSRKMVLYKQPQGSSE